jgi:hypothetical protein
MRVFTSWEEVKEAYGWVGSEPIAKVAKRCFEVKLVQRYDETDADFKKRVSASLTK